MFAYVTMCVSPIAMGGAAALLGILTDRQAAMVLSFPCLHRGPRDLPPGNNDPLIAVIFMEKLILVRIPSAGRRPLTLSLKRVWHANPPDLDTRRMLPCWYCGRLIFIQLLIPAGTDPGKIAAS